MSQTLRISRYPARLAIPVDQQTFDNVQKLADAADLPGSEIGRQLLASAIPPALKLAAQTARRRQRTKNPGALHMETLRTGGGKA